MTPQNRHDRRTASPGSRPPASRGQRAGNPVLGLQRTVGNRETAQLLARKGDSDQGTFEKSVRIGRLGPIEITGGNVDEWVNSKDGADDLKVTSTAGEHSDELQRLAESGKRLDAVEVQVVTGQNSWMKITFKNARIKGYARAGGGRTESWKLVGFDGVHRERTSIGKPRP